MTPNDFAEFWTLVVDVWQNGIGGVDVGRILIAVGIVVGFLVLRGLIARFLIGGLRVLTKKTRSDFDDQFVEALSAPLRAVPVVFGLFVAINYLDFDGVADEVTTNVVRSLIAIVIFWGLHRAVTPLSRLFENLESIISAEFVEWMVKAVRIMFILVGLATVLQIWGIQIGPIIAGAGLFGVAVALGAQDLFKNLIAGILILAEKRFRKGDWVLVDGLVEGTVESIGFRSTMIRRFDKAPVMVPNARLSDTAVVNFSFMTYRRIFWHIGVEYRTTVDQLREIRDNIEKYILETDAFTNPDEATTFVRIDRFSNSSIDILLYTFTRTTNWGEWLKAKEELAYAIKDIVENAGTAFAFPSTSLYVEKLAADRPEAFTPPSDKKSD